MLSEFFTLPTIKYFEEKIDYIQGGEVVSANLIVGSTAAEDFAYLSNQDSIDGRTLSLMEPHLTSHILSYPL